MATKLMIYTVEDDNGNQYDIEGPEGATPEQLQGVLAGGQASPAEGPPQPSGETLGEIFNRRLTEAQGERPGLDPVNEMGGNNPFIGDTGIPNPLHTIQSVADVAARGGEYAGAAMNTGLDVINDLTERSGLADALSWDGNKFLPGSAVGAFFESSPLGGIESGLMKGVPTKWNKGQFEVFRKEVDDAIATPGTTRADIDAITSRYRVQPFGKDLDEALRNRDRGGANAHVGDYQDVQAIRDPLERDARAFQEQRAETPVSPLEQEAQAFKGKTEPTPEDLFPTEEGTLAREQSLENSLQAEADAFRNRGNEDAPEVAPAAKEAPEAPAPAVAVDDVVNRVNEITADWTNSPKFEIVRNADEIPDEGIRASVLRDGPGAKGVIGEDGKVRIFADNINSPDEIPAIVFHEALGHNGMTQLFRGNLDETLVRFYNEAEGDSLFRENVDKWIANNRGAYEGQNLVARAADEVLAEMSQGGQLPASLMNRIKNQIKAVARRMGMKAKFSDREIQTILGMAHDAVINGKDGAAANGFRNRFMNSTAAALQRDADALDLDGTGNGLERRTMRRAQSQAATEELSNTPNGNTRSVRPFPEEEPDYWRFRHVTDDGEAITGFYHVENGALTDFNVNSAKGPTGFGPKVVRKIGRDLLKEHPEAKRIEGYRISGARVKGAGRSPFDAEFVSSGNRFMQAAEDGETPTKISMTAAKMRTVNDIDDLLDFIHKETDRPLPKTIDEIRREGEDFGLTAGKYLRGKSLEDAKLAGRIDAAAQLLTNLADELGALEEKVRTKGMTPADYANMREKVAIYRSVYARFDEDTAEVGRGLRVLSEVRESRKSAQAANRFMEEAEASGLSLDNPDILMKYMAQFNNNLKTGGPAAASRFVKNSGKLRVEDYLDSIISNMMLSSPKTWTVNFVGSPLNFMNELMVKGVTSLAGQVGRVVNPKMDRVYGREIAARIYGPLAAMRNFDTWKNIGDAIITGESGKSFGRKVGSRRLVSSQMSKKNPLKYGMSVVETPRRVMAGTDELWRNILHASNLYGEVANEVAKSGLRGQKFWDEVSQKVTNPDAALLNRAKEQTDRLLFNDTPSRLAQKLLEMQTPRFEPETVIRMSPDANGKLKPTAKTVKEADNLGWRTGKFTLRTIIRFVPTLDSIARTAIRNSGPLALISKEIRSDLRAGGVRRQAAMGRIATSSAILSYWAAKAAAGELTGIGDPDFKKEGALSAARPPMSIKIGNEWISYQGLDPISAPMAAAATAVERSGGKLEFTDPQLYKGLIIGMAEALKSSSYAESISNLISATSEGIESIEQGESLGPQMANLLGGQVATVSSPAFVRWVNQKFLDTAARDTRGDGSFTDRVTGRIKSGLPELSETLPQRHDVYGRPVENPRQERFVEDDPVVQELHELEKSSDDVLVGVPGARVKDYRSNPEGEMVTLTAEDRQEYQRVSGSYFLEAMRVISEAEGWKSASDDIKKEAIKELLGEAREAAREDLFGAEQGEDTQ